VPKSVKPHSISSSVTLNFNIVFAKYAQKSAKRVLTIAKKLVIWMNALRLVEPVPRVVGKWRVKVLRMKRVASTTID
jgi:hypothetical protein